MIDLQAFREAYAVHDISNVGFIRGLNNPADGLTKIGRCHPMYHLLLTGRCAFIVEQWVRRSRHSAIPTNYLSTVPIFYDLSCCSNNIHPSQNITSSYERLCEHESLQTVPVEELDLFSFSYCNSSLQFHDHVAF